MKSVIKNSHDYIIKSRNVIDDTFNWRFGSFGQDSGSGGGSWGWTWAWSKYLFGNHYSDNYQDIARMYNSATKELYGITDDAFKMIQSDVVKLVEIIQRSFA